MRLGLISVISLGPSKVENERSVGLLPVTGRDVGLIQDSHDWGIKEHIRS